MPLIPVPRAWSGLDDAQARNTQPPEALLFRAAADATNKVAGRNHRVFHAQHVRDADGPTATRDPFLRFVFRRGYRNGQFMAINTQFLPLAAAPATAPRIRITGSTSGRNAESIDTGTIASPDDLNVLSWSPVVNTEWGDPAVDTRQAVQFGSENGFRVTGISAWEQISEGGFVLNTARGASIDPSQFIPGQPIRASHLDQLYQAQYRIWRFNRKTHASWGGWAFVAANAVTTSSTSFVNLLDTSFVQPLAAAHPSIVAPARYSSMALSEQARMFTVAAFWAAVDNGAGGAPVGNAELQIQMLNQGTTSTAATVIGATAAQYVTTEYISTGVAYEQIGLYGRVLNGADRLLVYAWSAFEEA